MNVFDELEDEVIEISNHALERSEERCEVYDEFELMDMVNQATVIAETEKHLYKRCSDFVYVLAKNPEFKTLKTVMRWEEFKRNIQEKIERYN